MHDLQERAVLMYRRSEAEEECLINRLVKRLEELKKEKETIAMETEREEEVRVRACGGGWLCVCVLE